VVTFAGDDKIRHIHGDLPCTACEEWLHLYLEGETDPSLSRAIAAHLERCPRCAARQRVLEEERLELVEALSRSPALSKRFPERVIGEIRRRTAEERDRRLIRRLARLGLGVGGLAGAAAVALVISLIAGRSAHAPLAPPSTPPAVGNSAPNAVVVIGSPERSTWGSTARERLIIAPLHCPDDLPGWSPPAGLKAEAIPGTLISFTGGPRLSETIEFSATIFRQEESLPCTRDINNDGQTNVSDAAHLFMLSMAPPESLNPYFNREELDLDCNPSSACLIY
jgi:hypothetical protein